MLPDRNGKLLVNSKFRFGNTCNGVAWQFCQHWQDSKVIRWYSYSNPWSIQGMQLGDLGDALATPSIEQLRQLVSKVLCTQSDFEEDIFRLSEKMLKKGQEICGIFFCLHGPRSVKLTAVWESQQNSIRFYGSNGEKFKTINLKSGDGDLAIA